MMNKLMLNKGKTVACLILLCLLLALGCRKDRDVIPDPVRKTNLITDQAIDKWYSENPISQVLPLDWKNARQATIDGSHIIRVPTLNRDLIKQLQNSNKALRGNAIASNGLAQGVKGRTSVEQNPDPVDDNSGNNPNYFAGHPPELYFVQPSGENKLYTFLFNFVPDDPAFGFGQNGMWTGRLYEWGLNSDTVLVQAFANSVFTGRYVQRYYLMNPDGAIELSRPEKLQSLTPIKDKQVSGIFGWLADKIADGLGAIGYLFGLTELVPSTNPSAGHHSHYRFVSHPKDSYQPLWNDSPGPGDIYVGAGLPIVSSYLSMSYTGIPETEVTYSSYNYRGAYQTGGGPNMEGVINADGIHLMEYLTLSPAAQEYILSIRAAPLAKAIRAYLDTNGHTVENSEFASWATEYWNINHDLLNLEDFKRKFLVNNNETVFDPESGNTYSFGQLRQLFGANPELIDAIKSEEDLPSITVPMHSLLRSIEMIHEYQALKYLNPKLSDIEAMALAAWHVLRGDLHFFLDVAGMAPVVGEVADITNGSIYFLEGDYINATMSASAAIPVWGWLSTGGKWVKKATNGVVRPLSDAAGKVAYRAIKTAKGGYRFVKVTVGSFSHAALTTLKAVKPADKTLTNLSRQIIDQMGHRIEPVAQSLKNKIHDIVLHGDANGIKTEELCHEIFETNGFVKKEAKFGSNNGFDGVYIKMNGSNVQEIIINEAKQIGSAGNIKLNAANPGTGLNAQMSDAWISNVISQLKNNTNTSTLGNMLEPLFQNNRNLFTKTVTGVDKASGEIVILKLGQY